MDQALYFKEIDNDLYIKAEGHITAAVCHDLKRIIFSKLKEKTSFHMFYIDLSDCEYMDSTFMGLLVGFNKLFYSISGKKVKIMNPSPESIKLLKSLGINKILIIENGILNLPEHMNLVSDKLKATTELLLKSHENLIKLSDENRKKFAVLHSVLKSQLNQEKK